MYQIPETIMEHIDDPHVIGIFIGDSAEPALSSSDDLASCVYNANFCGGGLTIGALCSANVSISAYGQHDLSGRDIVVKLGFGDAPEWLQLGVFRVCECRVGDDTTSITAYDAAYWATGGEYTPTIQTPTSVRAVLEDVCEQCNITLGALPATADRVIDGRLTGYTARQIIMRMAAVCGCNALIDRSGALRLKWLADNGQSIGPDEYYADELTNATTINIVGVQMKTKITTPSTDPDTGITVEHEEEKAYTSASGTGRVLAVDCPYANQELVDNVADNVAPLSYTVGSVSFIRGYDVEPGDMIEVTSLNGDVHSVPVLGLTLSLDGGCRATVRADGYSDTDTSANFDTEYQQALSRLEAAIIAVKNLTADNIEAQSAYIKRLSADEAFVNRIFANDIKATGTIEGVELVGTKISGESMYVGCTSQGEHPTTAKISVDFQYGGDIEPGAPPDIPTIALASGTSSYFRLQGSDVVLHTGTGQNSATMLLSELYGVFITGEIDGGEIPLFNVIGDGNFTGTITEGGTALEDKYLKLTGGTITGKTSVPALHVTGGRAMGSGDDEGIVVEPVKSNGFAGVCVGSPKGNRGVFYIHNGRPFWRWGKPDVYFDIYHPGQSGTIALTADLSGYLPLSGGSVTGVLSVGERLTVHGRIHSPGTTDATTTLAPNLVISGQPYGAFYRSTSSSRRYKTDITDLPMDDIRGLYSLPVRTFRYKDGYTSEDDERYGKRIPGFIAEELEDILPIAVDHVNGKTEMWNSNILVPCLMRLVQDLNERVETLEKRLEEALERKEDFND